MTTDDIDWLGLADSAAVDPLELKRRLDLVAVCEELGLLLEEQPDGRWLGLCPFHDDHRPSFDVYETDDGFQRCGCFACDFGPANDVYDLLRTLRGYGFSQALGEAQRLAVVTRSSGVRERKSLTRAPVDLPALVEAARAGEALQLVTQALMSDRGIRANGDWVRDEFRLGVTPDGSGVVVPHYAKDGTLVGVKTRRPNVTQERPWEPQAVGGSKLTALYGEWRDQGRKKVVIVEGESDTWSVAWLTRSDEYEVFGLPSGGAARPRREWLEFLSDRDVTLMFDADDGGRTALRNWTAGLAVCSVAQLREGMDPTSENPERVLAALVAATQYGTAPSGGLVPAAYGGHLVRAGDENQTMICDFIPTLRRTVDLPSGFVFQITLPSGVEVDLPSGVFNTDRSLRKWTNEHGYVWQGTTKDAQELYRMLVLESIFLPRVTGVTTAGWAEGAFVLPDPHGVLGSKSWAYVPPETVRNLDELIDLVPGPWDPQIPFILTQLHTPEVITPIIGWIAASMLRPFVKAFPILAVVGTAGAGKSTLLRETLRTFGFMINLTLTSTTPMGVSGFASATNALPVWFDEYRMGARDSARQTFEQVLRDAWESQHSYKGGFGEQRQEIHSLAASSPIAVTGEDAFQETSHLERMCLVNLPLDGRNANALASLYSVERRGFGRAYLEWLIVKVNAGELPEPPTLVERPVHARSVARWGYEVFDLFAQEVCGRELIPFDAARLVASHETAKDAPIVVELIRACENRMSRVGPIAWRDDQGNMCVKPHDLVKAATELMIPIPGGARALRNELSERYVTTPGHSSVYGEYLRIEGFDR